VLRIKGGKDLYSLLSIISERSVWYKDGKVSRGGERGGERVCR